MRHQLVRLLGRGVEAERVIDIVALGKRHAGVAAIDARTRGIDEMLDAVLAAAFEDIRETEQIAVHVGGGMGQRVTHAGLRREMDHPIETTVRKERRHRRPVGDIHLDEAEIPLPRQAMKSVPLEADIVIVIEVVDAEHAIAPTKKLERGLHTDETGSAGDENFQGPLPSGCLAGGLLESSDRRTGEDQPARPAAKKYGFSKPALP
jgi:hypothetical protein